MRCKYAPRYRVKIKIRDNGYFYGIVGRQHNPLTGMEARKVIDNVLGRFEDVRGITHILNARCVGLEWMERMVEEMLE